MQCAHRRVAEAIKDGTLKRPDCCDRCDIETWLIEAHHPSYDRPLQVQWLCRKCHRHADKRDKAKRAAGLLPHSEKDYGCLETESPQDILSEL